MQPRPDDNDYSVCSPGYMPQFNYYPPRRLSIYHIECNGIVEILGDPPEFRLQSKVRVSYNERICVDYINITESNGKYNVYCGNNTTFANKRYEGNLLITFRSSQYNNNYKGFQFNVQCSPPKNTSQQVEPADCIRISQYLTKRAYKEDYTNELMVTNNACMDYCNSVFALI